MNKAHQSDFAHLVGPSVRTASLPQAYLDPRYMQSLAEFGEPLSLPRSGASYLKRPIDGLGNYDGLGGYPYLVCADWKALAVDLAELDETLVSFSAVPEPFGKFTIDDLQAAFPHRVVRFKDHYVADLERPILDIVSSHHRKEAERALSMVNVEFLVRPLDRLDEWVSLFAGAIERFNLSGLPAFSRRAFEQHVSIPGVSMSVCWHEGSAVAAHLWFQQGDVVYAHLAAGSIRGRAIGADYALYFSDIDFFSGRARWIDWGGVAGARPDTGSGLDRFKRGWSTGTRVAYFCGRVMDSRRYARFSEPVGETHYFPAYRLGEFK